MTPGRRENGGDADQLDEQLAALRHRHRESARARIATLSDAAAALLGGDLGEKQRREAEREAHKLAGSLGTYGLPRGSEIARELELRFGERPADADASEIAALVESLRRLVDEGAG
jgi:HPt (histidine-containing phosphotransfer) domain-containing protein